MYGLTEVASVREREAPVGQPPVECVVAPLPHAAAGVTGVAHRVHVPADAPGAGPHRMGVLAEEIGLCTDPGGDLL